MEKINIATDDYEILNQICKKYTTSTEDLLHRLVVYDSLTENILQLPSEITPSFSIIATTVKNWFPTWIDNIGANLSVIQSGKDISKIPKHPQKAALIIGAGPSLKRHNHLEILAKKGFDGVIFATDSILKECLEHGIIPDYVLILDGSDRILEYIDHDIIDKHADKLTAIMSTHTHPKVVNRWNGDIYWFNPIIDDIIIPNLNFIFYQLTKKTGSQTAGHVSSLGWAIARIINCNPIILIGVDLSYPADIPVEETKLYKHHLKRSFNGNKEETLKIFNKYYHHTFFNTDCYYDSVFDYYLSSSLIQLTELAKVGFKIYNCTEGGAIEGEGIECIKFEECLKKEKKNG